MSHVDTPWTRLASRTARGLLARKGVSYEELAKLLASVGVHESPRSAEGKVQRGGFQCQFFLQLLCALQADLPKPFQQLLDARDSWEAASTELFLRELAAHSLTFVEVSKYLAKEAGLSLDASRLEHQVMAGTYQFTLLLQLSLLTSVEGMDRFVDTSDVRKTGQASATS
ncbi:DUF6471 domain-containing protein [Cupriavidus sp. BIS7]|uniref:DUF6471 domain-containing protein n=1 Tax=Cupriavidus sp. BIS7 TaxID=1217718 RepID=UPI0012F64CDA|nr:DUF6471 domain-containing protein [Cupriavidus sp. BIS7]